MITFTLIHPDATEEHLGLLPEFWSLDDPRSAREQADANYAHGGGWRPFDGFEKRSGGLRDTSGPPLLVTLAEATLRDETITIYDGAWVAITQADGSFEVSRMD